jgi:hypothetical protein
MVIREAVQHDSANDWLTVASRVGIVCQGSARWVSTWVRRGVTAQSRLDVSTIPYPVRAIGRLDHVQITRPALNYARTGEPMAAVLWGIT